MWRAGPIGLMAALLLLAPGASRALEFPHGVASGEVTADSAVLWTRTDGPARLRVEVERLAVGPRRGGAHHPRGKQGRGLRPGRRSVVRHVEATAESDFTVRVQVAPLTPDATFRYRFVGEGAASEVGTFRTAPRPNQRRSLRFAYSGDSDGTRVDGIPAFNDFETLRAALDEGIDFFVYHGDVIYADSPHRSGFRARTLEEFREAYAVNRGYANLRALLAGTSSYVTWDDHEVVNNYDGQTVDPDLYQAARRAFHEYLPAVEAGLPEDPTCAGAPRFRVHSWGSEVDLILLDVRSCRSHNATNACFFDPAPTLPAQQRIAMGLRPELPAACLPTLFDPARTLLGPVQKELFKQALLESEARFKLVLNGLPIQQFWVLPYDRWEGYAAERNEILNFIRDREIENVVFLGTDRHASWVNEVFVDRFSDPEPIAPEFITGPIAFTTQEEALRAFPLPGPTSWEGFNALFDLAGVECRNLNEYSYAVVDVDATTGRARVAFKDGAGAPVLDTDSGEPCGGQVGGREPARLKSGRSRADTGL